MTLVSIITPTYNRYEFMKMCKKMILSQDYPQNKIEWLIFDDGETKIKNIVNDMRNVRYYYTNNKLNISTKRKFLNDNANGDIIICFDDDDYYYPGYITNVVNTLNNTDKLIAGSTILFAYFVDDGYIYQYGPYNNNHSCHASMAYKREYLKNHKYDNVNHAEETSFTNGFTEPMIQLKSNKTILCIAHNNNTYKKDKEKAIKTKNKVEDLILDKEILNFYKSL
jgi:glycosyltransferase involved in cell wall biosynthesis